MMLSNLNLVQGLYLHDTYVTTRLKFEHESLTTLTPCVFNRVLREVCLTVYHGGSLMNTLQITLDRIM